MCTAAVDEDTVDGHSGTGVMLFLPAPGSPAVRAGTVHVTFENIAAYTAGVG